MRGIMIIVNVIIWSIGLLFLFDNLGYDVTTVIAGLGVGGIAVALAAQNILGDLFNYLVIFFDRPFEIGDFVIVDDKMGNGGVYWHQDHPASKACRASNWCSLTAT